MMPRIAAFALLVCALCATLARADVSHLGYNRFGRPTTRLQRQQARPTAYPAAGFRPQLPFDIPPRGKQQQFFQNDLDEANAAPSLGANGDLSPTGPNLLYAAPARLRSFNPAPQQQPQQRQQLQRQRLLPQQMYAAPEAPQEEPQAERITAASLSAPKSERLTDNREDREDDDDNDEEAATDIEVDARANEPKPTTAQPTTNVVYYPAGAVGFVHPLAAYVQPAAAYYAPTAALLPAAAAAPTTAAPTSASPTAASDSAAAPARVSAAAADPVAAPLIAGAGPQFHWPRWQRLFVPVHTEWQSW